MIFFLNGFVAADGIVKSGSGRVWGNSQFFCQPFDTLVILAQGQVALPLPGVGPHQQAVGGLVARFNLQQLVGKGDTGSVLLRRKIMITQARKEL